MEAWLFSPELMSVSYQQNDEPNEFENGNDAAVELPPTPFPLFTVVLIAAIGCVFVAQLAGGMKQSILVAGFDKSAFLSAHEYWRILTGAALHGGPLHVIMNCYAFFSFGKTFEFLSGRAHLPIVFLLAAIGGGVLSLLAAPDGVSVGASGGILGVIGYLAVYAFRRRRFVSAEFRKNMLVNIGFVLVFGLVLFQQIDNFAHIGGLVVGAIYAFVQIPTDESTDPRTTSSVVDGMGLAALGVYLATCVFAILLILNFI